MSRIILATPLTLPTRHIREIELREPGRALVRAMTAARSGDAFTDEQALRYASRLSGLPERTLSQLSAYDFGVVREALESAYVTAARRDAARQVREGKNG